MAQAILGVVAAVTPQPALPAWSLAAGTPQPARPVWSLPAREPAWSMKAYSMKNGAIQMDLSAFTESRKAGGSMEQVWHPATNMRWKGAKSWCNVLLGDGERQQFGIMYSRRAMSGTEMPGASDQVAVFMPDTDTDADLERGELGRTMTLTPVTQGTLASQQKGLEQLEALDDDADDELNLER